MDNNIGKKIESGLLNNKLDGGGNIINNNSYTSIYDMLVLELEKRREEINKIL